MTTPWQQCPVQVLVDVENVLWGTWQAVTSDKASHHPEAAQEQAKRSCMATLVAIQRWAAGLNRRLDGASSQLPNVPVSLHLAGKLRDPAMKYVADFRGAEFYEAGPAKDSADLMIIAAAFRIAAWSRPQHVVLASADEEVCKDFAWPLTALKRKHTKFETHLLTANDGDLAPRVGYFTEHHGTKRTQFVTLKIVREASRRTPQEVKHDRRAALEPNEESTSSAAVPPVDSAATSQGRRRRGRRRASRGPKTPSSGSVT